MGSFVFDVAHIFKQCYDQPKLYAHIFLDIHGQ
jgi:hypothetical protein